MKSSVTLFVPIGEVLFPSSYSVIQNKSCSSCVNCECIQVWDFHPEYFCKHPKGQMEWDDDCPLYPSTEKGCRLWGVKFENRKGEKQNG